MTAGNPVVVICGPTASGKSALALETAKRLDTEIVSADSMQIYRGMDIGTAKPTAEERASVTHRMIDVADPIDSFTVEDYRAGAEECLLRLAGENRVPVVCGGTGFYINALLYRFSFGKVKGSAEVREKYEKALAQEGKAALFARLAAVDPASAEKLHPNDVKRVIRALEIYETTGRPKSEQQDGDRPIRPFLAFSYAWEREVLYRRIERRVDEMLEAGLVSEVEGLLSRGVSPNAQSMQGIGYKEVVDFLNGKYNHSIMSDIIKKNTRNYAKRQITFFKRTEGLIMLDPQEEIGRTADRVVRAAKEKEWIFRN